MNRKEWKRNNGRMYWIVLGRRRPTDDFAPMGETDQGGLCFTIPAKLFPNTFRPLQAMKRTQEMHPDWTFEICKVQADNWMEYQGPQVKEYE